MLSIKFPRCFFFRQHMIRHPSTTNQDGINTQIKGVFFLHGIFGSKSIQNKLKIRREIRSLFPEIDIKSEKLDTANGYLTFKKRHDIKFGRQTRHFEHFLLVLVVKQYIVNDDTVQQSYIYPANCHPCIQ